MKKCILVLGYFGYVTNQIDGQTIRTRNVYELLKSKNKDIGNISLFDTQCFSQSKFLIFKMVWMILLCDKLVYVPAHNNLKYIFPFIYIICKLKRIDILYIVVGGWLADYLKAKKLHIFLLRKIRGIFTQSYQLRDTLIRQYKFNNVTVFHNFRIHSFIPSLEQTKNDFKLVFMARINRFKGIDAVFRLAEHIELRHDKSFPISIDFYGPIEPKDEAFFREQIDKFTFVSYKGIVEPEHVYNTLAMYDLSILPTKYPGEGFPGTILDAYISGLPVVVSNWKYLPEFVDQGKTGYVYDLNNEEEFYHYVYKLYKDPKLLFEMKQNAYEKSKIFSSESAWIILQDYFIDEKNLAQGWTRCHPGGNSPKEKTMYIENLGRYIFLFFTRFLSNQLAYFAPKLYVKITQTTGRGKTEKSASQVADYFVECFHDYRNQLDLNESEFKEYLKGKTVLEYGPGDILGVALLMYAYGAEAVKCVDRFPLSMLSNKNLDVYMSLLNSLDKEARVRADNAFNKKGDVRSGFNPKAINYMVTKNGLAWSGEEYDLIISRAVLEHVNNLEETFHDIKKNMKINGISLHKVDLSSHGLDRYTEFDFLTLPDPIYKLMYSHKGSPNRWRMTKYRELAFAENLRIKKLAPVSQVEKEKLEIIFHKISSKFIIGISPDELSWRGFWLWLEHNN